MLDDLLEMIWADPDDDAPRQIYADALLEAGDPRGDFIAIQFKLARGEATANDVLDLRGLMRDHEEAWLGDLFHVLVRRVYRAGFLDRAALARVSPSNESLWDNAVHDVRLGTVRTLDPGYAPTVHYQRFVFSPAMTNLHEVSVLSREMLEAICDRPRPWGLTTLVMRTLVDGDVLSRLAFTRSLPALQEIAFRLPRNQSLADAVEALRAWPERKRYRALSLVFPLEDDVRGSLENVTSFLGAATKLAPVERLGIWLPMSRTYVMQRDNGRAVDIEVRDDLMLADVLQRLKGYRIEEVTIRPPPREPCCNLDNPRHLVAALKTIGPKRVHVPEQWNAAMSRGY